jgi:predicted P-loop ATPase
MPRNIIEAAQGHWPQILSTIAGLSSQQLNGEHQPCPVCGGSDRYRFDDKNGRGTWICSGGSDRTGCCRAGTGMDLLLRVTGWDFATAARRIEAHLNLPPDVTPNRSRPHRIPEIPPPDAPPPVLGRATAQWCYRSLTGQQLFWIQRFDIPPRAGKPGRKIFIHRVWLDGRWHFPRSRGEKADPFSCEWPTPRPLYRLPDLANRPDAPVLVVEGEKAADAAAALFPAVVVVSWSNGSKAVDLVDWSPLTGRCITLWPDADVDGALAMSRLARRLLQQPGTTIRRIEPPDDAPSGWDVADADWSLEQAAIFVRDRIRDIHLEQLADEDPGPLFQHAGAAHQHTPTGTRSQANNPEFPDSSTPRQQDQQEGFTPSFSKPIKLEAGELLAMLRTQAAGGRLRYNTFSQQIELDGAVIDGAERFYLTLAGQGFKVGKELSLDCLIEIAHENTYDPVRLYLEHVEATVDPAYIGGLATGYLRPEDVRLGGPTLYDHMLRCTLIGAVRRAFEPGWKHDTATVLMGDQGARKSSFWNALGGPFFSDALGDCSSKDDLMILHRSWIMEWAELDHVMSRKHAGQIKNFLSQATDLFRVPYGKATESFPRRGIIVGSTNRQTGFLVDDTGNRRFWIIPVTRTQADPIDTGTLMADRDAIWAGAVAAYRAGELNYLSHELAQLVNTENEAYQVSNPWEPTIAQWLAQRIPGEPITTERILLEAVEKPTERQTRADQMAVADVLRTMGYERRRTMQDGQRTWRWFSTA